MKNNLIHAKRIITDKKKLIRLKSLIEMQSDIKKTRLHFNKLKKDILNYLNTDTTYSFNDLDELSTILSENFNTRFNLILFSTSIIISTKTNHGVLSLKFTIHKNGYVFNSFLNNYISDNRK